jgi:hypothetical protein
MGCRQKHRGAMSAIREWTKLTFQDVVPFIGVPEKDVEKWVNRFSESFFGRLQLGYEELAKA